MKKEEFKYYAFISYSSKDEACAKKLHKKLENYRIPKTLVGRPGRDGKVPRKIFPVFRDRDELPLSSDLGNAIQEALRASRYLIVICSPNAAASKWVNEEIRYFKSLTREDNILAIILNGEPNAENGEVECYPLALRHRLKPDGNLDLSNTHIEPIGGNLRKDGDGWKTCILRAVAGITGMGYNTFVKREKKRGRIRAVCLAALTLILLAGGILWWDYTRTKVHYYAHLTTRWGVPEGVVRLSSDQTKHREFHYRIESSRGKVRKVSHVNSSQQLKDEKNRFNFSIREISYGENGTIQFITLKDHNGRVTCRMEFSELKKTAQGREHYIKYTAEHQEAPLYMEDAYASRGSTPNRSDITDQLFQYRPDGLLASRHYLNTNRYPRANTTGVSSETYEYGPLSLPIQVTYLGKNGTPTPLLKNIALVKTTRDTVGNPIAFAIFGPDKKPVSENGSHMLTQVFNEHGNNVEVHYFGTDKKPVFFHGYHTVIKTYSTHGNLIEYAFFGIDKKPTLDKNGIHATRSKFDKHGNVIELTKYETHGKPILDKHGIHKFAYKRDGLGNVIEATVFGINGKPTLRKDGYYKFTQDRDERGNLLEERHYGITEKPVIVKMGYHRISKKYDKRDNVIEEAVYGIEGKPILHRKGFHKLTNEFDERGNLIETVFFDINNNPVLCDQGQHKLTLSYDKQGNIIERNFFGTNEQPVLSKTGYHKSIQKFDVYGNNVATTFFGTDGKPTLQIGSIHRVTRKFNNHGVSTEGAYFGVDGYPVQHKDGYHKMLKKLDEWGNTTEVSFSDPNGKPVLYKNQYHKCTQRFDTYGNLIDQAYFGTYGEAVSIHYNNVHRITYLYSRNSKQIGYIFYDPRGNKIKQFPPSYKP